MSEEKIKKAVEAKAEEREQENGFSGELSEDDLDAVSGGLSFTAGQNLTVPKNDR